MNNKGVPEDFFFARGDDVSVQDFAAGQLQVPKVNSFDGQGSHNRGPGSWNNQANADVHPPPGNNGHVPSHGSNDTKATSTVATSGYFGSTNCTPTEINARRVICPKTPCRAHGSCNYSCHQDAETCALPHIFASAKHFHAKNSKGEASNKYANLQS
jgi:hypothetical protein